jgi:hypothetical protein
MVYGLWFMVYGLWFMVYGRAAVSFFDQEAILQHAESRHEIFSERDLTDSIGALWKETVRSLNWVAEGEWNRTITIAGANGLESRFVHLDAPPSLVASIAKEATAGNRY